MCAKTEEICFQTVEPYQCQLCPFLTHFLVEMCEHNRNLCSFNSQNKNILEVDPNEFLVKIESDIELSNPFDGTSVDNSKVETKEPSPEVFKCEECSYQTDKKKYLASHRYRMHLVCQDESKWHQCAQCEWKFKFECHLSRHQKQHLPDELIKWYPCAQCEYKTKRKSELKRHTMMVHTPHDQIEWHHCTHCSYRAKVKHNLRIHLENVHFVNPEFEWHQCEDCEYVGKSKNHLYKHRRNCHLPNEKIKWFQCEQCQYKTKRNYLLTRHRRAVHPIWSD